MRKKYGGFYQFKMADPVRENGGFLKIRNGDFPLKYKHFILQ